MEGLDGRVAIVTGATGGIGRALAQSLASEGCRLVVVARQRDRLESLAENLARDHRAEVHPLAGDAATAETNRGAVAFAVRRWGHLDFAVGCAGSHEFDDVDDPNVAERLLRQNVLTKAHLAAAAGPSLKAKRRGHILFVSSMASTVPLAGQSAYCASMSAVDHLARSLAVEFRPLGVHVHAYAPGLVDTPLARKRFTPLAREKYGDDARVERFWKEDVLQPQEAARDIVAILKNPDRYKDAVVPRPPKVVL
jgi:NAD(P)-dependent dehydrogenase (short-subunit alcohol dehydrogenase family)